MLTATTAQAIPASIPQRTATEEPTATSMLSQLHARLTSLNEQTQRLASLVELTPAQEQAKPTGQPVGIMCALRESLSTLDEINNRVAWIANKIGV